MDGIETLPYDETRVISGIVCQTCGTTMSLHRGRFPICDDCIKDLREIISKRRKPKVVEIGGVEYMERRKLCSVKK